MDEKAKAKRYRERAMELRRLAESKPPDHMRTHIMIPAVEYERLAELQEQAPKFAHLRTKPAPQVS